MSCVDALLCLKTAMPIRYAGKSSGCLSTTVNSSQPDIAGHLQRRRSTNRRPKSKSVNELGQGGLLEESALQVWCGDHPARPRFTTRRNLDEAYHLLGRHAGALRLWTARCRRVIDGCLRPLPAQRRKRLGTLKNALRLELSAMMQATGCWLRRVSAPLVKTAGARAAVPARRSRLAACRAAESFFETLLAVQQPRREQVNGLLRIPLTCLPRT